MIISKLLKYILYYFVLKIIYKFIKKYKFSSYDENQNINIETVDSDDFSDNNLNECTTLVLYKPIPRISRQKYNLKNIYNNFFNGIREDVKNDINPVYLKTEFKKRDMPHILLKDFTVRSDNLNELIWSFETKSEYLYKIKTCLKLNSENACENIELTIKDIDGNAFIYDYILNNIDEYSDKNIYDFSFILDNNEFGDNNITVELNVGNSQDMYKIDSCMIEIIEKKLEKNVEQTPILIFDVNERYTPIYFNETNILDIDEFEGKIACRPFYQDDIYTAGKERGGERGRVDIKDG
jgi:hypothetical protein